MIKDIKETAKTLEIKYNDLCKLIKKDSEYYRNIELDMLEEIKSLYLTLKSFLQIDGDTEDGR
jgi:hypothetical protein